VLRIPKEVQALARFGRVAVLAARNLAERQFRTEEARALFAGLAGHSFLRLEQWGTSAFGLVLALAAHDRGWPMPRGGAQQLTDALAAGFRELRGEIVTGVLATRLEQLPKASMVLLDVTPRSFVALAGARLSWLQKRRYLGFPHGPGVFKIDYALSAPIPWAARECAEAAVVHVGGGLEEIAHSEREVSEGKEPARPFVLVAQPTLFDATRAPRGHQIAWVYCHVPNGSRFDMTIRIEEQLERFAPGFRDCVLGRHTTNCMEMESANPNYAGGDISGGSNALRHLLFRPVLRFCPYRTPLPGVFLCSASTPPGGGVHGMCGFNSAEAALSDSGFIHLHCGSTRGFGG
jgi:phytoene dehydrogenase-like protein